MAILLGGGFAFGGIAAYSGMVNTGSSNSDQQQPNLTAPSQTFIDGQYNRSSQEKLYIASQNDYVFITGYYQTKEQRQQVEQYRTVAQNFNNRAYIEIVNASVSPPPADITSYPAALVIGSNRGSPTAVVQNATASDVRQAACNGIRNYGSLAATCVG